MASSSGRLHSMDVPMVEAIFNTSSLLEITLSGQVALGQGLDPGLNSSDNSSDSDGEAFYPLLKQSPYMILLYTLAYGLVFLAALVGNVMVVVVVGRNPALHSVTNYFLVNLAVADVLVALFCVPVNLVVNLFAGWQLGAFMCKAAPYLQGVSVCASVNTLATIALDRYFAICHSLHLKISKRTCKIVVLFIWLAALGIMAPWLVFYNLLPFSSSIQQLYVCHEEWPSFALHRGYYMGVIFVACYTVPLAMIVACYALIGVKVWRRHALGAYNSSTKLIHRSKVKVIKMLAVVCALFAFSWLPLYGIKFWRLTEPEVSADTLRVLNDIVIPLAQWLGSSNCCVNPIIYCFFSKKFSGGFRDLMACCACARDDADDVNKVRFHGSADNTTIFRPSGSPRFNGKSLIANL